MDKSIENVDNEELFTVEIPMSNDKNQPPESSGMGDDQTPKFDAYSSFANSLIGDASKKMPPAAKAEINSQPPAKETRIAITTLQGPFIRHQLEVVGYPEFSVRIKNPDIHIPENKRKLDKVVVALLKNIEIYNELLQKANLRRYQSRNGVSFIGDAAGNVILQLDPKQSPESIIKRIKSIIESRTPAKFIFAGGEAPELFPMDPPILNKPKLQEQSPVNEATKEPATPPIEPNGNKQKRNGAFVRLDQPNVNQVNTRPYALHDTNYNDFAPKLDQDKIVVVLDAGILQRCFGVDMGASLNHLKPHEVEQLRNFGRKVFDSLVNNPRVAAVIIPDYVADIECCERITNYDSGKAAAEWVHGSASEHFSTPLEDMLKHALRRWEDDRGQIQYMCDSTGDSKKINPKVIIWESEYGKEYIAAFKREKRLYDAKLAAGEQSPPKPGLDFGERVIEALINDAEFPAGKKMVLSTDYKYVRGELMPLKVSPNICRSNFGNYLQSLILKNIPEWADVCGYTESTNHSDMGPEMVLDIRNKMREDFNRIRHPNHRDDTNSQVYCDNPALFKEATGLHYAGRNLTIGQIIDEVKGGHSGGGRTSFHR